MPEGPEGSITKAGTDPEPQGERGEGGALGDPIMRSLSTESKKQKGSDRRGIWGEALSTSLQQLFHTLPNTCCYWQMYKCVNTLEAYRETKTGLGIVMCKLQPLSNVLV